MESPERTPLWTPEARSPRAVVLYVTLHYGAPFPNVREADEDITHMVCRALLLLRVQELEVDDIPPMCHLACCAGIGERRAML